MLNRRTGRLVTKNGEGKDMNEHEERVLHLVGEDTQNRGENQKQFRREDGMRESVVYDHPVHYKKDGA